MKATTASLIILIGFAAWLAVDPAHAQERCSVKVVHSILQEEWGKKLTWKQIGEEVERCKVAERASTTDDRCSSVVAHASFLAEGKKPSQADISRRADKCKAAGLAGQVADDFYREEIADAKSNLKLDAEKKRMERMTSLLNVISSLKALRSAWLTPANPGWSTEPLGRRNN